MTSTIEHTTVDAVVKAKHRALWASGDYPRVATELILEPPAHLSTVLNLWRKEIGA